MRSVIDRAAALYKKTAFCFLVVNCKSYKCCKNMLIVVILTEQVWGAGNAAYPGTHAKYTIVSSKEVRYFLYNFLYLCGLQ